MPTTSAAARGAHSHGLSGGGQDRWYRAYMSATDRYAFVASAALAAYKGDGRAALYVGDAVFDCIGAITRARRGENIQENLQSDLEHLAQIGAPAWISQSDQQKFDRCKRIAAVDPFAKLPPRNGGYASARYWWDRALEAHDPAAEAREASQLLMDIGTSRNTKFTDSDAQDVVNRAVSSNDPMAMFIIGQVMIDGRISSNSERAMAISLAACDLGYDCTWNNPQNTLFAVCKYNGLCPESVDYSSWVRSVEGDEAYARIYAQAQELETNLKNQSTSDILRFINIYRPMKKTDPAMSGSSSVPPSGN